MPSVVYVDDEKDLCELFYEQFEDNEYQLNVFQSANEALEHISQNAVDLLVLDFRIKELNAFELLEKIKKPHQYCIVSGELDLEIKQNHHECLGVIGKPMESEAVIEIFKKAGVISE